MPVKNVKRVIGILACFFAVFVLVQTRLVQNEFQRYYAFIAPDCHRVILEKWKDKDVGFLIGQLTSPMPLRREAANIILLGRKPVVSAVIEKYRSMLTSRYAEDRWTAYAALTDFNVHVDPVPIVAALKLGQENEYFSVALHLLSCIHHDEAKKYLLSLDEKDDSAAAHLADNAKFWQDLPEYRVKVERIAKDHPDKWRREEAAKVLKEVWGA
jgi:hypothetical protein